MTYLVLARKWRPRKFAEMVGQEHVVRALTNALTSGRVHHAFLFTGTRGVGKTTVARIFAKSLNCETGVGADPCGTCSACREIDEGRFVDLIEVDAASRTKVEDTRELLENVQYAPARGRYKVYLVDEVHMLSVNSFNALLKTLEEPPPHVKFLLATTDPQKLPITVVSRCLQFHLKRLPPGLIAERMRRILEAEGVAFDAPSLPLLARAADGSLRDGLSLLDQVLVFGGGRVGEADVRAMLGTIDRNHVVHLVEALAAADAPGLLAIARALDDHAPDYDQVLVQLASLLERVALQQVVPQDSADAEWAPEVLDALARAVPPADLQLYYQIALNGRRDLELAPEPRVGFEMTLLRMLAFRPADTVAGAGATAAVAPAGGTRGAANAGTAAASPPAPRSPARPAAPEPAAERPASAPGPSSTAGSAQASASQEPRSATAAPAGAPTLPTTSNGDVDWQTLVGRLELGGLARQLAANCAWLGREADTVRLRVAPSSEALRTPSTVERLAQALGRHLGGTVRLVFDVAELEPEIDTPARREAREAEASVVQARAALEQDPTVRALQERFGATVQPDSVKPLR